MNELIEEIQAQKQATILEILRNKNKRLQQLSLKYKTTDKVASSFNIIAIALLSSIYLLCFLNDISSFLCSNHQKDEKKYKSMDKSHENVSGFISSELDDIFQLNTRKVRRLAPLKY